MTNEYNDSFWSVMKAKSLHDEWIEATEKDEARYSEILKDMENKFKSPFVKPREIPKNDHLLDLEIKAYWEKLEAHEYLDRHTIKDNNMIIDKVIKQYSKSTIEQKIFYHVKNIVLTGLCYTGLATRELK